MSQIIKKALKIELMVLLALVMFVIVLMAAGAFYESVTTQANFIDEIVYNIKLLF